MNENYHASELKNERGDDMLKTSTKMVFVAVVLICVLSSYPALASLVRFDFSGVVKSDDINNISWGTPVSGYYIFSSEPTNTFLSPSEIYGNYYSIGTPIGLNINIGTLNLTTSNALIEVWDYKTGNDGYRVSGQGSGGLNFTYNYGASVPLQTWELKIGGPGLLDVSSLQDRSLPLTPPTGVIPAGYSAALWGVLSPGYWSNEYGVWVEPVYENIYITFRVTDIHLSTIDPNPVPIPAAVWLLGSGLIGLIGIRRFRK